MRFLRSPQWRIFLIAWILYSVHFATNVVREHYPAFSLIESGTLRLDRYQGFHSDIFVHRDGHSYINNQVFVSVLAAIPLKVFQPVLDYLEQYSKRKLAEHGVTDADYHTDKPMRVAFFRLVKEQGLDLRFGAATFVTSVFFMAPLSALFLVFFFGVLRHRGVGLKEAGWLTFLLGFGTPIFFRTSTLNHNMFVMYEMFIAFIFLWVMPGMDFPVTLKRRLAAGFFGGLTLATDYIGVIILPLLWAYLVLSRLSTASWKTAIRESLAMVAGSIPPILFLLYTQWSMFGNPFFPSQHWMPDQNEYATQGMRGFTWPAPDLFLKNLFDPGYGLYTWAPLLLLGLIPMLRYRSEELVLSRRERRFVAASFLIFLLFCSANQYARLQWNSGLRYLMPMVPLIFLAITDHLLRMSRWVQATLAALAIVHSWVLTVFREISVQASWGLLFHEGIQLPWLRVLRMTSSQQATLFNGTLLPTTILCLTLVVCALLWRYGAKLKDIDDQDLGSGIIPIAPLQKG